MNKLLHSKWYTLLTCLVAGYLGHQVSEVFTWLFGSQYIESTSMLMAMIAICFMVGIGVSQIATKLRSIFPKE
jgi:hypothetical protein